MSNLKNCTFAIFLLVLMPFAGLAFAEDPIRVVTTTPDLADIVRQVGGDRVEVISLTNGTEDLHNVRPRPRLLNAVFKADVLVQIGLDLEHSWLPQLLNAARNDRVRPGTSGFINCSAGIEPLDIPKATTRKQGPDLHLKGNPHYNLSPIRGRQIVSNIVEGLCNNCPECRTEFQANGEKYLSALDEKIADWKARLAPFKGAGFIEYHPTWTYFANDFGLEIVERIEAKAGVTPHASQIAKVSETAKRENIGLVVSRPVNQDIARKVATSNGATAITLPHHSSTKGKLQGYIPFMEHIVSTFEKNLNIDNR